MPRRRRTSTSNQYSSTILTQRRNSPSHSRLSADPQETQDCHVSSTTTNLMQEIQSFPIVTTLQIQQNDPELDADKKTIVSHPLYPLLALLLQQCELASARPDSPPPLDAFNMELKAYVQRQMEIEDAELLKARSNKGREKGYYDNNTGASNAGGGGFDQPPFSRSNTTRSSRYNTNKVDNQSGVNDIGSVKSSRPQSRDNNLDFDKGGAMKTEYNQESGADDSILENDRKLKVFVNNSELDELIVKAIQVLRIHLLELHKVNELCKDFCSRYIHSLKTKFQSDPIIHDSQPSSPGDSEIPSPGPAGCYGPRYFPPGVVPPFGCPGTNEMVQAEYRRLHLEEEQFRAAASDLSPTRSGYPHSTAIMNGHGLYGNHELGGVCYTPNCHVMDYGSGQFTSKSIDEDDRVPLGADSFGHLHPFLSPYGASSAAAFHAGLDNLCVGGKQKRGVLPKRATQIMKQWLFQHLVHPYPTEDEKRQIANQTNLTLLQVNNWFINARRRILQPMLDASNFVPLGNSCSGNDGSSDHVSDGRGPVDSPVINKKKKAATSRPSNNRFWPASLVAAAAIHPVAAGLVSTGSATVNTTPSVMYSGSGNGENSSGCRSGAVDQSNTEDLPNYCAQDHQQQLQQQQQQQQQHQRPSTDTKTVTSPHAYTPTNGGIRVPQSGPYSVNECPKAASKSSTSEMEGWAYEHSRRLKPDREPRFDSAVREMNSPSLFLQQSRGQSCTDCLSTTAPQPSYQTSTNTITSIINSGDRNTSLPDLHSRQYSSDENSAEKRTDTYGENQVPLPGYEEINDPQRTQRCYPSNGSLPSSKTLPTKQYKNYPSSERPQNYGETPEEKRRTSSDPGEVPLMVDTKLDKPNEIANGMQMNSNPASSLSHPAVDTGRSNTGREKLMLPSREISGRSTDSFAKNSNNCNHSPSHLQHDSSLNFSARENDPSRESDYASRLGPFPPPPPADYSSALLSQAQNYRNYLAYGMGISSPLAPGDSSQFPSTLPFNYPQDPLSLNPFSTMPHLPPFHSPSFSAASLVSPHSTRSESIFTGLTDQWQMNSSFGQTSNVQSLGGYPFSPSWTRKLRSLNVSANLDNMSDLCNSPPHNSMEVPTSYDVSLNSKLIRNHPAGDINLSQVSETPFVGGVRDLSNSEYFGPDMNVHESGSSKADYSSQSVYPKIPLTGEHSLFRLSSSYLPNTLAP